MAERALPPGAIRRRALFGLVDADGWTWAFLKAIFWFFLIIFLLGYLPDRAYYFTVFPTLDVGANVISPVNFCDASNKNLPCPAPAGAVVPWERNPRELTLPAPRTRTGTAQSGTSMYLVGGATRDGPTQSVLTTQVTATGNFGPWTEGPALPQPRADAAVVTFSGVPYVIGGVDRAGRPTDTVFVGVVTEGQLQGWEERRELRLPRPVSAASAVSASNGIWVLGGRTGERELSRAVYRATMQTGQAASALGQWEEVAQLPLPEPRADAGAVIVSDFIYVLGGESPQGITNGIFRLQLGGEGDPVTDEGAGAPRGWAISQGGQSMPEARRSAAIFSANGAIYVVGGRDGQGRATNTTYWAVPATTTGQIPEWKRLDQIDLREPRADAAPGVVGSFVFLIGGESDQGPFDSSLRANLAPKPPFFRLGLFGATIPALSIKGEIGQQLGYINAAGVGMTNFVLLVLIAWAFSHPVQTRRFLSRVTRGRIRGPREDEYFS